MKINDLLTEAPVAATPSNVGRDYINMLNFVKSSGLEGVPPDQQVAVALFKELQKQQQKNTRLGQELSAAERRIDQAMQSDDLRDQELAMHQTELDRERTAIEKQQEKMGQIDRAYSERGQASERQMQALTAQLAQLKDKPGVDQSTAEQLQRQIEKLEKQGIGQDKFQELQKNIESIQSMQQVDDEIIKDLVSQIRAAESESEQLSKTKQTVSQDLEKQAQQAIDKVDSLTKEIQRIQQLAGTVELANRAISDVIGPKLDNLEGKVNDLDNDNLDDAGQFNQINQQIRGLTDTVIGIKQQLDRIAPGAVR